MRPSSRRKIPFPRQDLSANWRDLLSADIIYVNGMAIFCQAQKAHYNSTAPFIKFSFKTFSNFSSPKYSMKILFHKDS